MQFDQRLVTHPIQELWNDQGVIASHQARNLSSDDIVILLRTGAVRFVVADVGRLLQWIPTAQCFIFWKSTVKGHIVELTRATIGFNLDDFAGGYCYFASEWAADDQAPIVLLRVVH